MIVVIFFNLERRIFQKNRFCNNDCNTYQSGLMLAKIRIKKRCWQCNPILHPTIYGLVSSTDFISYFILIFWIARWSPAWSDIEESKFLYPSSASTSETNLNVLISNSNDCFLWKKVFFCLWNQFFLFTINLICSQHVRISLSNKYYTNINR